jgi:hypothetical protein
MDLSARMKSLRDFGKAAVAAGLVLLLFASALAAGSPDLHKKLHSDHGSPSHACLASTLEQGQSEGPLAAQAIFTPPVMILKAHVKEVSPPASVSFQAFNGRGPPCQS